MIFNSQLVLHYFFIYLGSLSSFLVQFKNYYHFDDDLNNDYFSIIFFYFILLMILALKYALNYH